MTVSFMLDWRGTVGSATIQAPNPGIGETVLCEAGTASSNSQRSARKKLVRRNDNDSSQQIRLAVQAFFLALNLWIGLQFYFFVRWAESGGRARPFPRPAGVEGWLPIEGLMQFKYVVATGALPRLHPAAFFLFAAFSLSSLVFRKSFCGWLCPVGTVSEYLWKLGARIFGRNFSLPRWLDYPLRSLKYLLLSFFAYAVAMMSAAAIAQFVASPYGLVVDVRMLNFFRFMGSTTAIVLAVLALASLLVRNFWCRYLCPYGALMGLISTFSPFRISRNESACIDCAKCAKVCPSVLPVDKLVQIRSAECIGCLECVAVCPAQDALSLNLIGSTGARRRVPAWQLAAGIAIIFFGLVGSAKLTGHWQTHLPDQIVLKLVPAAGEQQHPMSTERIGEDRE
jgi:polyferredoxin